jgi:phosphoglycolate phosphatase
MTETLEGLAKHVPLAVLTNKPVGATTRILEGLGLLRHFRKTIGGDTAFGRKPDPAGLTFLAETAGVAPARALLVGDSPVDLATARNAGAQICLARYGFGYRFSVADFRRDEYFIDAPGDLMRLLAVS